MKVRKLAIALALAGSMGSNLAYALGLGDAEIKSNLNEPLRAEIELVGVGDMTGDEVIANLAPERDFRKIGIEPIFFLNEIQFKVVKNDRGELVLQLTTKKPVREPYLNFLVEVAWPSGRLLREYALLIDPPVFRDGITAQPVQVAATPPTATRQQPQTLSRQVTETSPSSATVEPTGTGVAAKTARVTSSDTLWSIAVQVRPADDLTPQQVMLALQDANPDAFIRNNINLVREGSILRVPTEEEIRSRTKREAVQQVNAQNRLFREPDGKPQVAAVEGSKPRTSKAPMSAAPAETGDELKLLAGDNARAEDGSHGGDMGGTGSGTAETRLALTLEELDQSRRENSELNSRLDDLHEQLASMQRLLELKNDRLASMQVEADVQAEADAGLGNSSMSADLAANGSEAGQAVEGGAHESAPVGAVAPAIAGLPNGSTQTIDASDAPMSIAPDEAGAEAKVVAEGVTADQQVAADNTDSGMLAQTSSAEAEGVAQEGAASVQQQVFGSGSPVASETEVVQTQDAHADASPVVVNSPAEGQLDILASAAAPVDPAAAPLDSVAASVDDAAAAGTLQQLMGNPFYQTIAGATGATGVAVLALLGFLARRRTRREEEEFYAQVREGDESEEDAAGADAFATSLHAAGVPAVEDFADDDAVAGPEQEKTASAQPVEHGDPAAEADVHLAYGGFAQAARVLENAISLAPERGDLRLKLLEVYADAGNEDGFAVQMREFEAVNDDAVARAQAESLHERLIAQVPTPAASLETETHADIGQEWEAIVASPREAEQDDPDGIRGLEETPGTDTFTEEEVHGLDFEFDLGLSGSSTVAEAPAGAEVDSQADEDEDDLEFNLDESDFEAGLADDDEDRLDLSDAELDALDLDEEIEANPGLAASGSTMPIADLSGFGTASIAQASAGQQKESHLMAEADADANFDESFLAELDAELDKVAGTESVALQDAGLGGLEFDGSENLVGDSSEIPTVDMLAVDDAEGEIAPIASLDENGSPTTADSSKGFDDSLLGEGGDEIDDLSGDGLDDDFDFLEDTDEAGTKLDLARAYVEMGDADGAREILEEVSLEGSENQKQEARGLLEQLS